jgi:hypothetical protein
LVASSERLASGGDHHSTDDSGHLCPDDLPTPAATSARAKRSSPSSPYGGEDKTIQERGRPLHGARRLVRPPPPPRCRSSAAGGTGPHVMHPARRFLGAEKSHHRSRQYRASSRPSQKTEKINFQNQCSDSRHPVHGPTKTLSAEVTGQSAAGTGVAVGVTMGGPAVIASTGAQEQRNNRQSNFGPTCRLASSPEAGPGATVGTLNQGYPLL